MSQDNKIHWTVKIGAIAVLLTALGTQVIFPDLVNKLLSLLSDKTSPNPPITQDKNSTSSNTNNKESTSSPQDSNLPQNSEQNRAEECDQTDKDFCFKFKECTRPADDEIACKVLITNINSAPQELSFSSYDSIGMIDSEGHTYVWSLNGGLGNEDDNGSELYSNIPILLTAYFGEVPPNANPVSLILDGYNSNSDESVKAVLNLSK